MFQQTFAIIRNTFFESIRQPVMLVVLVVATLLIIVSNPLSGYTMSNDQKMLIDVGLATIFMSGAVLAAFIATSVLGREIENRTALTVISKPVSRPLFVLGKYLGVACALTLATVYLAFVFMLVEQHTVLQTVRDPIHVPVIIFGVGSAIVGLGVGIWCNYFYNKVFSSTVICVTTPLAGLAYLFSLFFRHDFSRQPISTAFNMQLWLGLAGLLVAILVLTAIAIAASTRLGQVMTLCVTVGVFLAGMLSDWMIGRPMARMESDWTQRASSLSDEQIQSALSINQLDSIRAWVRQVHRDRALQQLLTWTCGFQHDFAVKYRDELSKLSPADRATFRLEKMPQAEQDARKVFEDDLGRADEAAQAVQWPPARDQVVITLDRPMTVERTNGECDIVNEKQTLVYPPIRDHVSESSETAKWMALRAASAIVPNFQVLWLSDAITQEHKIPISYLARSTLYGIFQILAALSLAVLLFQRREVG